MDDPLQDILERIRRAADARDAGAAAMGRVRLLAVSKTRSAGDVRALAARGQHAFGENYVQEALAKQRELADPSVEWHLIGHLQSNKAREASAHFDWVQTVDRPGLVPALSRHRPAERGPLNVLIQVNIDDAASKSGCDPADVAALADAVAAEPRLALRGLMAIPDPDASDDHQAFHAMKDAFDALRLRHPRIDTLSMGMSGDFEAAIAAGSNLVRIGTALFGARSA